MHWSRKELIRLIPFAFLFVLTLVFYRGDYEQIVGAIYIQSVVAFVMLCSHWQRKAFFPYADIQVAWKKALETPLTASLVYIAKLAFLFGLIWLAISVIRPATANGATEPTARAKRYLPTLSQAIDRHWPAAPLRHITAGQIEQESAGWNEHAELKTSREYGFGLAQITVTDRFNNFKAAQKIFKDWKWEDRFNVKYQLGYAVITNRSNFKEVSRLFRDDDSRWRGSLVAYNAGFGTVLQRRALAIRTGWPPDRWVGGLDKVKMAYERKLLYGRPLGQMRDKYPHIICDVRAPKYRGWV